MIELAHSLGIRVIGLTGGIASGKSTVARCLRDWGHEVIDADALSRDLTAPGGAAEHLLIERFGTADRARLRALVFSDPKARKDLESIVHPLIHQRAKELIRAAAARKKKLVIYEAALLIETDLASDLDGLIVVEAPQSLRRARALKRPGLTEDQLEGIFKSQASDQARRAAATWLIDNSGTLDELEAQVQSLSLK